MFCIGHEQDGLDGTAAEILRPRRVLLLLLLLLLDVICCDSGAHANCLFALGTQACLLPRI